MTDTEPGVRGDTASGGGDKPATLETGATVRVPLFVNIGDRVKVSADEPVKTPIEGEIASLSVHHVAIRRHDPALGEVVVHFPRIGYVVSGV